MTLCHLFILPCTSEVHTPFPQDLSLTVVEPCLCGLCGYVQDHQGAMQEPFH